ncbi:MULTISPECIES: HAD-IA family hydrolase [Gammaproteobacteria]|uniref:HAD family hydrolase n=1 Tax=Gammaproteobacteria TaxID=1236 RepID=UPI001AD9D23E|nr:MULTISPECIES: HAD-IA family hydrolase [Gammaproteobacteria]MBO9479895.1 HAD-IA family hydrolase [Salinisphaera sp. G21_0]MBO9492607.1 HAD-IA family hydrolase [Thalassotalea sp. G20_0]
MMKAIEGVFFDLDGTLLDTAEDFVITVNQMLADHQHPAMDSHLIRQNVSAGSRALMKLAFNLAPGDELEQKRALFLQYYDRHIQDHSRSSFARPYPGILSLIGELERRDIAWGIVTNKPRPYAISLIRQIGLLERSHAIVCPEDVKKPKPDPEALFLACRQSGSSPRFSVYIGDHIRDIEAGKQAGMITVAAHYGYIAEGEDPAQWGADLNIDHIQQLHRWFEQHNWQIIKDRSHA